MTQIGIIEAPTFLDDIPGEAQWLSGQGTGGWFHIEEGNVEYEYRIRRYSPDGRLECDRLFHIYSDQTFDITRHYRFTHISHCQTCTILQDGNELKFNYKLNN